MLTPLLASIYVHIHVIVLEICVRNNSSLGQFSYNFFG